MGIVLFSFIILTTVVLTIQMTAYSAYASKRVQRQRVSFDPMDTAGDINVATN